MKAEIQQYNEKLSIHNKVICDFIAKTINTELPESTNKIWHAHPVWFLNDNPIVGYSLQKKGIRLMFWSGADFEEDKLNIRGQKFKDASIFYNELSEVDVTSLKRWIEKSKIIQWDYKNIVKRKGKLERIN